MTLINLKDLGVTLGVHLFSNLNLTIAKGDRIGLVAANGRGKSTLLHCLAGTFEPSAGNVTRSRGLRCGHVQQHVPEADLALTFYQLVLRALTAEQAETESWRVDIVLDDLAVPDEHRTKPLGELSGGWQRIALLARAWVNEPDILLLDEPTNHLDLSRIGIFQHWLDTVARNIPLIVASHDRAFLDSITNRTLFLRENKSPIFDLPYTAARQALSEVDAADERRFANDMKQAQDLRRQAAKLKNIGINSGSDLLVKKTKQLKTRAEKLEQGSRPAHQEKSAGAIKLGNSGTHAKALIYFENATITTPDGRALFQTGKVWINRGDRVVLLGRNGTGKTRLVSALQTAMITPTTSIKSAASAVLGFSDQGLTQLDQFPTPADAVMGQFDIGDHSARTLLAGAGINIDLQSTQMSALSGGQKARLAMLVLRLTEANFYLLDEPTNHLDIDGQEALEAELQANDASCLLVSHDRTFIREVGNRFWLIEGKKLTEVDSPEPFFNESLNG